jgi:hypothetical protein
VSKITDRTARRRMRQTAFERVKQEIGARRMDGPLEQYTRPTKISQMVHWACQIIGHEHREKMA